VAAALACAVWIPGFASPTDEPDITLYMPALASEGPLGLRAATVLNLQIWQTLRRAPFPNPDRLSFGNGTVMWGETPLTEASHDGAERQARSLDADMVLWGKAWRYGGGVAVQVYLTIVNTPGRDAVRRWSAGVTQDGKTVSLAVGLPRLRYEFAPIVLTSEVVESLRSPAGLPVVAEKGSARVLGDVGPSFQALQHDGPWVKVQSGSLQGWVHVPQLSRRRSEIVDFVGGVIRVMRNDWAGAAALLERVTANPEAPRGIQVDASLLLALARAHLGRDRLAEIRRAYDLNPHDVVTTKYECMEYVSRLAAARDAAAASPWRRELSDILDQRRYLYAQQDPWFGKVRQIVGASRE
jgi:hypothetical protein